MESKVASNETQLNTEDKGKFIEAKVNGWMEKFSFVITIFIFIYFILIIPDIFEITNFFTKSNIEYSYLEFLLIIPSALFSFGLYKFTQCYLIKKWRPYISPIIVRQNETPEDRLHRLGEYVYKLIYDSFCYIILLNLSKDTIFAPPELGGTFDIYSSTLKWPYEVKASIRIYYMIALGHYFERLSYEAIKNRNSNSFFTMIFHHMVTMMMIFLSYMTGHQMYGITVLLTHDLNDIFLNLSRLLRESVFPQFASFFFIILAGTWLYTRIYIFSKYVLYGLIYNVLNLPPLIHRFLFLHYFFIPALFALFVLNLFWLFQIIRVFLFRFVKKDKNLPFEDFRSKKNN